MLHYMEYSSPLGLLTLISDGQALTQVSLEGTIPAGAVPGGEVLTRAAAWLDGYFRGQRPALDIPLAPAGTDFQRMVWGMLATIPYGATRTYGELAREAAARMGRDRMAPQAIGQAVGRNPIAIFLPCHRVVGADGALTGYAWGLERKKWLLRLEGSLTASPATAATPAQSPNGYADGRTADPAPDARSDRDGPGCTPPWV